MNKSTILEKLEMLESLCVKTEPDVPDDKQLFTEHSIAVQGMIKSVRDLHTGKQTIDTDSERNLMISVMRESNKIWRLRNKIKNGEWEDLSRAVIEEGIEEFLAEGMKINAIKYYRSEMKDRFKVEVGLRDAKDYVDQIHNDMRRRGMLSK